MEFYEFWGIKVLIFFFFFEQFFVVIEMSGKFRGTLVPVMMELSYSTISVS